MTKPKKTLFLSLAAGLVFALICSAFGGVPFGGARIGAAGAHTDEWTHENATRLTEGVLSAAGYVLSSGSYYVGDESGNPTVLELKTTIDIQGTVTICLNGSLVRGVAGQRVIKVTSGQLTLDSCQDGQFTYSTETNGRYTWTPYSASSGVAPVSSPGLITGGVLTETSDDTDLGRSGAGIYVCSAAKLVLRNGEISGNQSAAYGGGVFAEAGATFTMSGGKITGNVSGGSGGGVYVHANASRGDAVFTMSDGIISGNKATGDYQGMTGSIATGTTGYGGGVCSQGTLTLSGGSIRGNTALWTGGGICLVGGSMTFSGTAVLFKNTVSDEDGVTGLYLRREGVPSAEIAGGFVMDKIASDGNLNLLIHGGYYPASAVDFSQNLVYGIALDTDNYRLMSANAIAADDPDYLALPNDPAEGEFGKADVAYAVYKKGATTFDLRAENIVYDGEGIEPVTDFTVRVLRNGILDISAVVAFQYSSDSTDGTDGTFSDRPLVNAGRGYIRISVSESKIDYVNKTYYMPTETTLAIDIRQRALTDETADLSVPYDGSTHSPAIVLTGFVGEETSESAGGVIEYSLTGEEESWSLTPPEIVSVADSKTVFYRVTFDNYQTVTGSCRVEITRATPVLPELPAASVACGQTLAQAELTEGWTWAETEKVVTATDATAEARYALAGDHANYDWETALSGRSDLTYDGENGCLKAVITVTIAHTLNHCEAVPPTCTEGGSAEHWHCTVCGCDFADEQGRNLMEETALPAAGHSTEHREAVEPTCTEDGHVAHWHCTVCELNFADEVGNEPIEDISIPAAGHSTEHREAAGPTCTEAGHVAHWHCTVCGLNFADEEGNEGIEDVSIPATGHTMEHHAAVKPTCTTAGNVEYWHCTACDLDFADEAGQEALATTVDPATGHALGHHAAAEATDEAAGNTEYWECEHCGNYFSDAAGANLIEDRTSVVIPQLTHTAEIVALVIGGIIILILAAVLASLIKEERRIVR